MTNRRVRRLLAISLSLPIAATVAYFVAYVAAYAGSDLIAESTWQPVKADAVRTRLEDYLQSADVAPDVQTAVRDRWRAAGDEAGTDMLERLAQSLAKADVH